jgi:hypothetical protein
MIGLSALYSVSVSFVFRIYHYLAICPALPLSIAFYIVIGTQPLPFDPALEHHSDTL